MYDHAFTECDLPVFLMDQGTLRLWVCQLTERQQDMFEGCDEDTLTQALVNIVVLLGMKEGVSV